MRGFAKLTDNVQQPVTVFAAAEGVQPFAVGPVADDQVAARVVGVADEVLVQASVQRADLFSRREPLYWKVPADAVAKEFYSWIPAKKSVPKSGLTTADQTMIVARIKPGAEPDVARIFGESDAGPLPAKMGVTGRWLYLLEDVYLHLLERTDASFGDAIRKNHDQPAFAKIMDDLSQFISAYNPDTWRSPEDAVAKVFYRWRADS